MIRWNPGEGRGRIEAGGSRGDGARQLNNPSAVAVFERVAWRPSALPFFPPGTAALAKLVLLCLRRRLALPGHFWAELLLPLIFDPVCLLVEDMWRLEDLEREAG